MSRLSSGLHYGAGRGYLFPRIPRCERVPAKSEHLDVLLAIATDLLAQSEAQHRTATRLESGLRQVSREARLARDRNRAAPLIDAVRDQMRALRELVDAECSLLEELERALASQ